ncbi:hypothetical protein D3C80_1674120 [compost metagenome]
MRLHPVGVGPHLSGHGDRRGRQDAGAGRHVGGMADSSGMHQLHKNPAACLVDAIGHASPALDLFLVEQSGNACITKAVG